MYYSVAENHNEIKEIQNSQKFFFPQSAILYSLLSYSNNANCFIEWDINECLSYTEKPGNWLPIISFNESKDLTLTMSSYLDYDILFFNKDSKVRILS